MGPNDISILCMWLATPQNVNILCSLIKIIAFINVKSQHDEALTATASEAINNSFINISFIRHTLEAANNKI